MIYMYMYIYIYYPSSCCAVRIILVSSTPFIPSYIYPSILLCFICIYV